MVRSVYARAREQRIRASSLIIAPGAGRANFTGARLHTRSRRETALGNTVFRGREESVFHTRAHARTHMISPRRRVRRFLRLTRARCEIRGGRREQTRAIRAAILAIFPRVRSLHRVRSRDRARRYRREIAPSSRVCD